MRFRAVEVELDLSLMANIIITNKNGSLIMDRALTKKICRLLQIDLVGGGASLVSQNK